MADTRRRVLVTGAAGHIGAYFAEHAKDKYDLRLMVRGDERRVGDIQEYGEVVTADLGDLARLKEVCAEVDTILHLAGDPSPTALWASLLENNIVGTYNLFAAAKTAKVKRVIYASSIHAVSGYPAEVQVKTTEPVHPGDLYGVSKCFGEALCRYMAEHEGVSAVALRIGAFQPIEAVQDARGVGMMDAFVSRRDLVQLIHRCIDAEGLTFALFHALSDNRFNRLDISDARARVGYAPQDDSTEELPPLKDLRLRERISTNSAVADGGPSGLRGDVG